MGYLLLVLLVFIAPNHYCSHDFKEKSGGDQIGFEDLDIWPLVTPILGPGIISEECKEASLEYIRQLSEALHQLPSALDESQRNALRRLDSGGPFPFLQEGILMDTKEYNICRVKLVVKVLEKQGIICKDLSDDLKIVSIPFHTAGSPGLESACKNLDNSKYCHNYLFTTDEEEGKGIIDTDAFSFMSNDNMIFSQEYILKSNATKEIFNNLEVSTKGHHFLFEDLRQTKLPKLSELVIQKNPYARHLFNALSRVLQNEDDVNDLLVVQIMIVLYLRVNERNGHSPYFRRAYHGVCYPDACTMTDININNFIFSQIIFSEKPKVISFPLIAYPGCTDDKKYNFGVEDWKPANWAAVVTLGSIGFLVIVGSGLDIYLRSQESDKKLGKEAKRPKCCGLGYKLLTAFSVMSNLEVIFAVSPKTSGGRLDCLDGMRAISMTWVILGHHFIGANSYLDGRNKEYKDSILREKAGGLFFEPLTQDFSVDSFLFIGATLLSYLLLKDLDKTKGWLNLKGPLRIVLFYINRYLRISIPYGLAILVFAGFLPLVFTEPMGVAINIQNGGDECSKYWYRHLLYYNTFSFVDEFGNQRQDGCMGVTWYLAFDMQWFLISPIVVYPMWLAKNGKKQTIAAVTYWILLFLAFLAPMIAYVEDPGEWYKYHNRHRLPRFPSFAPWGQRSHCYLLGLLMGFILHSTKNKNIKIPRALNLFLWGFFFYLACLLTYGTYTIEDYPSLQYKMYTVLVKALWGVCLAWVTFACVKGYGGPVNDFLSWGVLGTVSKISFMTYLFHIDFDFIYYASQTYVVDFSMWHVTSLFVAQLCVDLFIGLIGCVTLELPFGKIQKIVLQSIFG